MGVDFLSREPVFDPAVFVGRAQDVAWAAAKLGGLRPQNCNLIGEPRSGKTSLLHHLYWQRVGLPGQMAGLYVFVRLANLPEHTSATFWSGLLLELRREMARQGLTAEETAVSAEPRESYEELENDIERLLNEAKIRRIVFFIDDFDLLPPGIERYDLDWLRALANHYIDTLAFVISSVSPLVQLTEGQIDAQAVSPLTNLFHDRRLGLLLEAEARTLCQQAAASVGKRLNAADLDFLLAEGGRHPELLKIASESLFAARDIGAAEEYEVVRADLQLSLSARWLCKQLWQRRTADEQAVLLSLAQGVGVPTDRLITIHLGHLGLVEQRAGREALFAEVFRIWLLRETAVASPPRPLTLSSATPPAVQFAHRPAERLVWVNGRSIPLTTLENRLLGYLVAQANKVCSPEALLTHVWSPDKTPAVVEKGINRLRAKIEDDARRPRFILSARGEGYFLHLPNPG
jgi:DNA-binding response OmpR family regulator